MEVHVSERRYKCGECGKLYKTIGHVREHMRAHSDERPYHCSRCNKGYKTKVTFFVDISLCFVLNAQLVFILQHISSLSYYSQTYLSVLLRMPYRCISGPTVMRNLMCVSSACEASGRRVR